MAEGSMRLHLTHQFRQSLGLDLINIAPAFENLPTDADYDLKDKSIPSHRIGDLQQMFGPNSQARDLLEKIVSDDLYKAVLHEAA